MMDIDLVIVFDVGDFSRTRTIANYILKNKIKILNIDHFTKYPKKLGISIPDDSDIDLTIKLGAFPI